MSFSHLHVHSYYSLLKASASPPRLAEKAAALGMGSIALTDYGNMFGALELYFQALEKGLNPVFGCETYYTEDRFVKKPARSSADGPRSDGARSDGAKDSARMDGSRAERGASRGGARTVVLLAKNKEGYANLCRISQAAAEGFYFVPRADYKTLQKFREGLIALTGARAGAVFSLHQNQGKEAALNEILQLKDIFQSDLRLEFAPKGLKGALAYNRFLAEASHEQKIPLIAANDVHYVEKKEAVVQDALSCIGAGRTLSDRQREKLGPPEFYLKSGEEMRSAFDHKCGFLGEYRSACDQTLEDAKACHVRFKLQTNDGKPVYHLPAPPEKSGGLAALSRKGLEDRFKEKIDRGEPVPPDKKKIYQERLEHELKIISDTGFEGYFLIVRDFIRYARSQDIPVGPGRGSGAGCLVSYCLSITDIDPIPLNLIFERFLNPERISMPDFDIDFCQESRGRVIDYIVKKYGKERISHIITYGRLNARAALRDVGRILGLAYQEVDRIVRLIPDKLGITLKEALKLEPRLQSLKEEDPGIKELLTLAELVEGLVRHVSLHAAGIIISDHPIVRYAPLYRGAENETVIQYDLKHAEKIGLVKFDFLGLKTLTQIKEACRLIEQTQGKKLKPQDISLKDPGVYEIMCQGDTVGVFQFEGRGITDILVRAQPTCFEDITAINALYRPGPMNRIEEWLRGKKGGSVHYIFPDLEPILKETYGVIIYQEQVQRIAAKIADYSYGEADILRRAMGKKIQSAMDEQKKRFLEGARRNGYDLKKSEKLFDWMAEFAKYGFNKSHAAAYCVIAAQTAYLKKYFPLEFFAAQMTVDQKDSDKTAKYARDARRRGIVVKGPHINESDSRFTVKDGEIGFSLAALKGVGEAAKEIVCAREKRGRFHSLRDFFEEADPQKVNKTAVENLIKAGALDGFGHGRREIFENHPRFLKTARQIKEDREMGQKSLFSLLEEARRTASLSAQSPPAGARPVADGGGSVSGSGPGGSGRGGSGPGGSGGRGGDFGGLSFSSEKSALFWTHKERLRFEKEALGFYLSAHPMDSFRGLEKQLGAKPLHELQNISPFDRPVTRSGASGGPTFGKPAPRSKAPGRSATGRALSGGPASGGLSSKGESSPFESFSMKRGGGGRRGAFAMREEGGGALSLSGKTSSDSARLNGSRYDGARRQGRDGRNGLVQAIGVLSDLKENMTKKSAKIMAFARLEDSSGSLELVFFPDVYRNCASLLAEDGSAFFVKGFLESEGRLIVSEICSLNEVLKNLKSARIEISRDRREEDLVRLFQFLEKTACPPDASTILTVGARLPPDPAANFSAALASPAPRSTVLESAALESAALESAALARASGEEKGPFAVVRSRKLPEKITADENWIQNLRKILDNPMSSASSAKEIHLSF